MDLDSCDEVIERALNAQSEAEFCHHIVSLFDFYEILSLGFGRGETIFWRARPIESDRFKNLGDLDYPPPDKARLGRLNDAGSPCFYAANSIHTAVSEIECEEGQLVQVAGFRIATGEALDLIVVGEYANVHKGGYLQVIGTDPGETVRKTLESLGLKALPYIYLDKFFASVLNDVSARDKGYVFCRALGALLHARVAADGIAFPSVRDPGGFNVAVKPSPSDRAFQNVSCAVIRVGKKRRFGLIEHEVVTSADGLTPDLDFTWPDTDLGGRLCIYGATRQEYMAILAQNNAELGIPLGLPFHGSVGAKGL